MNKYLLLAICSFVIFMTPASSYADFHKCGSGYSCSGPWYGYHQEVVKTKKTLKYYLLSCDYSSSQFVRYLTKGKWRVYANLPFCYWMVLK